MKKVSINKGKILNSLVNFIIIICIVSVFSICFNVDGVNIASAQGYSAIYKGNTEKNNCSLMINVYWGTEFLDDMLKTLEDNNVKATFFVGGCWVAKNPDYLKKIFNAGHEIGNHGYYHKDHSAISLERNKEEIEITHQLVKQLIDVDMTLFMPPSGAYGNTTLEVAESLGYSTIMWSKDTIDWRDKDEELIFSRATNNIENGDLVLMHPTECTKNALDRILKAYAKSDCNLTIVSETLN